MSFAEELLTFLQTNKEHFGYYFQCDDFIPSNEVTSSHYESVVIMRDGDENHPDWFPNTTQLSYKTTGLDYETPITIILWTRHVNSVAEKALEDIYRAAGKLPELSYIYARRHPNGLASLDFVLSDEGQEKYRNFNFIVDHINRL
jgi:hypothetical protein